VVYFEHNFQDGTGIRLADVPDESLKKEVPTFQFRISAQGMKSRVISCPLYDKDEELELFPLLVEGLLQEKIKEIGHQCIDCKRYYLPSSPNQKRCSDCSCVKEAY
jgi:hypothetical protein